MSLAIFNGPGSKHIFINQFLHLQKSCRFVPAYISQVVRAGTPYRQGLGIVVLKYIHFIISTVSIIPNPEDDSIHKMIMLY
jgi:hypothetical protein